MAGVYAARRTASTGCTQCNRHWREVLQAGPQGRHWALECQKAGHWPGTGHSSASLRLACACQCPQIGRHWALECRSKARQTTPIHSHNTLKAAKVTQTPAWGPFRRASNDLHAWYKPTAGMGPFQTSS
eukprot:2954085-Prymnesium_polylepis.2